MSTHNIDYYEDLTNYLSIIIKFHQVHTLSLLLLKTGRDQTAIRGSV